MEAAGGRERIVKLWNDFKAISHSPLDFSTEASAVFSAHIEGNTIDLNSFIFPRLSTPPIAVRLGWS